MRPSNEAAWEQGLLDGEAEQEERCNAATCCGRCGGDFAGGYRFATDQGVLCIGCGALLGDIALDNVVRDARAVRA